MCCDILHFLSVKFIYSEKATKSFIISTVDLTGTRKDKSTVEISKIFVAFSEYVYELYLYQLQGLVKHLFFQNIE